MTGPGLHAWLVLGAAMFALGLYGVLTRRNVVGMLLGVELMANAANLNLVAFSRFGGHPWGQATAMFAIALTVAEVVVGLALVLLLARTHDTVEGDAATGMRG